MSSSTIAFNEHQAWLHELRVMHAAHMAGTSTAVTQHSPLPAPPMMWALPDEANDVPSGFGGFDGHEVTNVACFGGFDGHYASVALQDDDFDAPVYRSLGNVFSEDALDLASDDESPRYRSLPIAPAASARPRANEADEAWLASMPPLIKRQKAMHSPLDIP